MCFKRKKNQTCTIPATICCQKMHCMVNIKAKKFFCICSANFLNSNKQIVFKRKTFKIIQRDLHSVKTQVMILFFFAWCQQPFYFLIFVLQNIWHLHIFQNWLIFKHFLFYLFFFFSCGILTFIGAVVKCLFTVGCMLMVTVPQNVMSEIHKLHL